MADIQTSEPVSLSALESHLWAAKPKERRGRILFINAVNEVTRERAQSLLEEEHIQKVIEAYREFQDIPEFARAVPLEEIRANQSSLNLALNVPPKGNGQGAAAACTKSLSKVIQEWQESSKSLRPSMDSLLQTLTTSALRGKSNKLNPKG
jgi:type I restriction enzyme M protein